MGVGSVFVNGVRENVDSGVLIAGWRWWVGGLMGLRKRLSSDSKETCC